MNIEEILEKIKKLEYQISILSECIDYDRYPVQSLILSLGWDSTQINKAHDIFQNFDEKLEKGEKINW
jgi:ABC-type Fe2+-enterobactin transport system substrate-binding protein